MEDVGRKSFLGRDPEWQIWRVVCSDSVGVVAILLLSTHTLLESFEPQRLSPVDIPCPSQSKNDLISSKHFSTTYGSELD